MVPNDDNALLDQVELKALLKDQVSESTLEKWRMEGRGPQFIRAGRRIFYRRRDVDAWMSRNTITHTHDKSRVTKRRPGRG